MKKIDIEVSINDRIALKDPLQTELGKKIIKHAIDLLHEIGFEALTFKKLAKEAKTTEASVYRYFENKYKLLVYLTTWYWDFMHFMLMIDIRHIREPKAKLKQAVTTLVNALNSPMTPEYIDQSKLHIVVVENASKVYHNKKVDKLNQEGYYVNYKKIIKTLSEMILETDKDFAYPIAFATNIVEQSLNNEYYLEHLPSLTDNIQKSKSAAAATVQMIDYMIDRIL